jgi:hypothetical protein
VKILRLIASCLLAALVFVGTRAASPPPIAIIGLDDADWETIDRLIAANRLPTFARLRRIAEIGRAHV